MLNIDNLGEKLEIIKTIKSKLTSDLLDIEKMLVKPIINEADCCIIVTEWHHFKKLKPEDFPKNIAKPVLVYGRRICDAEGFSKKLEFNALGLGK